MVRRRLPIARCPNARCAKGVGGCRSGVTRSSNVFRRTQEYFGSLGPICVQGQARTPPPPNDNVTDVSGVNIWEWQACRFFGLPVNFVVAPDVLSVLLGTCLDQFPVPWYPPHGDRIAFCVVVDKVSQISVSTFPVWQRLTPLYYCLVVERERVL